MNPFLILAIAAVIFTLLVWAGVCWKAAKLRESNNQRDKDMRYYNNSQILAAWESEMDSAATPAEDLINTPVVVIITCDWGAVAGTRAAFIARDFWNITRRVVYMLKAENLKNAAELLDRYGTQNPFAVDADIYCVN